jgi:vancomycin aglycone glucosyltransferase
MRVLIATYGSRGDVQPMVALGVALRALNVDVQMCAPPDREFIELLARNQIPLVPALASVQQWVEQARKTGMKLPELADVMIAGQFNILDAAAEGCGAIVATGLFPSRAAAQLVAESRGVYFASVHFCPQYLPSPDIPPVAFPGWPHPEGVIDSESLWAFNVQVMNSLFGDAVNKHRVRIGLKPVENVRDHVFTRRPWLASDPVLGPWRPSGLCDGVQTGAWTLSDSRPLPADMMTFLNDGAPPVYCGFGSMGMQAAPGAGRAAIEAIRAHGRRTLVARGLAGLDVIDDRVDCFVVGEVNQQALFPKVAAVIHHGGAGTTLAAAQAGTPQLIVPQVADQPYWASQLVRLGIGVAHGGPVPSFASLASGLDTALAPLTRERAKTIASKIRADEAMTAARMLVATCDVPDGRVRADMGQAASKSARF